MDDRLCLCFECKKLPGTRVHRRIVNGQTIDEHYCMSCYLKKFVSVESLSYEYSYLGDTCPNCGTTVNEIKNTAFVGCAECYRALAPTAVPMVVSMQQGEQEAHRGKVSENVRVKNRLECRIEELNALIEYYTALGETMKVQKLKNEKASARRKLEAGGV